MSDQQPSPPPPSPKPGGPKNRSLSKIELFALTGIFLFVGYILLERSGVQMVERTEEVRMNDRPQRNPDHKQFMENRERRKADQRNYERRAEDLLQQFIETEQQRQGRHLDEEEKAFLEKASGRINPNDKVSDSAKFFKTMRNSYRFYKAVKDFGGDSPPPSASLPQTQPPAEDIINGLLQLDKDELQSIFSEDANVKDVLDAVKKNGK